MSVLSMGSIIRTGIKPGQVIGTSGVLSSNRGIARKAQ